MIERTHKIILKIYDLDDRKFLDDTSDYMVDSDVYLMEWDACDRWNLQYMDRLVVGDYSFKEEIL